MNKNKNFHYKWRKFIYKKSKKFPVQYLLLSISKNSIKFNSKLVEIYQKNYFFTNFLDKFSNISGENNFHKINPKFFLNEYRIEIEALPIGKGYFSSGIFSSFDRINEVYCFEMDFSCEFRLEKINFKNFWNETDEKIKKGNITSILFFFHIYNSIDFFLDNTVFELKGKYNLNQFFHLFIYLFSNKKKNSKIFTNGQLKKFSKFFPFIRQFFFRNVFLNYSIIRNNFGPEFRF